MIHARHAWVDGAVMNGLVIEVAASGQITALRRPRTGDPPPLDGLVVPGLVNAHLHLESSWAWDQVPGGEGLPAWVSALRSLAQPSDDVRRIAATAWAARLQEGGTALVCDVSNEGTTAPWLDGVGLAGVMQHEVLGMHRGVAEQRMPEATAEAGRCGRIVTRPSPHATYSTPASLLVAAAAPRGDVVGSIHVSEDPAEAPFLASGTGPLAAWLDRMGLDWGWFAPPAASPVGWLKALGVLGPHLMCVHGVHLSDADRQALAETKAALCLCPRSNLHIGGQLADVPALLAAGVRLCLGTDSLASSPDLDVLGEIPPLLRAFPDVPAGTWLDLATRGGAEALGYPDYGEIKVGGAPGLLLLEGVRDPRDLAEVPARRWIVRPGTFPEGG